MPTPAELARAMHDVIEPINSIAYFAEECATAWAGLGIEPVALGYFAGRGAPLGRVPGPVLAATFFNFSPGLVQAAADVAWSVTTPEAVLTARADAMQATFERLDVPTAGVDEATELLRRAMADVSTAGRPLAAANAGVAPSGQPLADLWQAVTTVREHRGDGHVALLTTSGLSPVEILVLFVGWQDRISRRFLQMTRAWDDEAWQAGVDGLAARGLADDEGLTEAGHALRQDLEDRTDAAATAPWEALGPDDTRRLWDLLQPIAAVTGAAYPKPFPVPDVFPG